MPYFNNCNTFDGLLCILYTKKNKTLRSLPPTSNISHGDDLRSYHVVLNCSNLILAPDTKLDLVEFDWNSAESVLMLNKFIVTLPKMYTVTFGCKKNRHLNQIMLTDYRVIVTDYRLRMTKTECVVV